MSAQPMEGAHGSRGSAPPRHGGTEGGALRPAMASTLEKKEESGSSTETLTLGDWVVLGHERKRGANRSGEVEERSEGSVLPQRTAAEVAGVGRSGAATAEATRTSKELKHERERERKNGSVS